MTPYRACWFGLLALVVAAGAVDARERRLPNGLAGALALIAAASSVAEGGFGLLAARAATALAVCGALVAFEVWWRLRRGSAGQGMGDIKALGALMLAAPVRAVAAYAAGLLLLGVSGLMLRRRSLPLLPYLAIAFVAFEAAALLA